MKEIANVEVEPEITMTSVELADVFEQRHKNVMARLEKIHEKFSGLTCKPAEYVDKQGESRPMFIIDKSLALRFAMTSRKENAPNLIRQLVLGEVGEEVVLLKNRVHQLEDNATQVIANPRAKYSLDKHQQLLNWTADGLLTHTKVPSIKHRFVLTDKGKKVLEKTKTGMIRQIREEPGVYLLH